MGRDANMITAYETMLECQDLGILLNVEDEQLCIKAPKGSLTLELKYALKEHKADILYILSLPEPAKPGSEVEALRREIGEMLREQSRAEYGT